MYRFFESVSFMVIIIALNKWRQGFVDEDDEVKDDDQFA